MKLFLQMTLNGGVIPKKDANNQLMVDDCGNLITETLYGKVEVKIG